MTLTELRNRLVELMNRLPVERLFRRRPVVGVLRLDGVIGRGAPGRPGINFASYEKLIDKLFAPRRLAAVALSINSPGGSPVQSALIARRIRDLAAEKDVPVIAFCEDVAASGGYWLACAADEIYADANSIVGSIGVISAGFGFADLIERYGIERRVHAIGERKGMLDPFRDERPEDVDRLVELQADIHENFKTHVRQSRGDRLLAPDEVVFNGDIWTGRQAQEAGLIDGLSDLRTETRKRFGERVQLKKVEQRPGLLSRLRGGIRLRLDPADLVAALDEWAAWKRVGL